MTTRFRRPMLVLGTTILIIQAVFMPVGLVGADTQSSTDTETVETFSTEQNSLLNTVNARANLEGNGEEIQEFSFDVKSFRTVIGQPTTFRFTSKLPSNEVLIRIPENGKIMENQFSSGESIQHSHGEYWILFTKDEQKSFEVSVLFEIPGNYFLTVDNDADHVYVEVQDSPSVMRTEKPNELEENETSNQSEEMPEQNNTKDSMNNSATIQPIIAVEENLSIPEELIVVEEERILEETRDIQNRSISSVNNWSQFRSAWNSSTVTMIALQGNIGFSSSILGDSLNTRSSSITITGGSLDFQNSGYSLVMSGVAGLTINTAAIKDSAALIGRDSRTAPVIIHNGSGLIEINNSPISMETGTAGSIISGQNINLNGVIQIRADTSSAASATVRATGIELVRSGTLKIIPNSTQNGWIVSSTNSGLRPVLSNTGSTIIIQADRFSMGESRNGSFSGLNSWNSIDVILSGLNGATVVNSNSNPNDFNERYVTTFNDPRYNGMFFNGGGWVTPPVSYTLSLQASPDVGGNPSATNTTLTQGSTTTLSANPNSGYRFVRWEVVSGTGANITNTTSATTTFTMGSANTTVRAVYEAITYNLTLEASPSDGGNPSAETSALAQGSTTILNANPNSGYRFVRWEVVSGTGANITNATSATTTFTMGSTDTTVQAVYETITQVLPVDPLDPEVEVDPENKPELPEDQDQLSIDFVSSFNFGSQAISARDQTYYAQPQRLLNEDGTVNESEERPNYVQISDRRPETDRHGWQLAVTQRGEFEGTDGQVLAGARLRLMNQQLISAQGGNEPHLQQTNPLTLVPNVRRVVLYAQGDEGTGTWVYRFGNSETAGESVALDVPKGANPEATHYKATLLWELSAVPEN